VCVDEGPDVGLQLGGGAMNASADTASPNEVLLEIQTSNLVGWIWGDCYSIVLLIEREALRRGDFSNVAFDISN
jgi:uncharacterized protein YwqG